MVMGVLHKKSGLDRISVQLRPKTVESLVFARARCGGRRLCVVLVGEGSLAHSRRGDMQCAGFSCGHGVHRVVYRG